MDDLFSAFNSKQKEQGVQNQKKNKPSTNPFWGNDSENDQDSFNEIPELDADAR